jgi:hypothetical protein
VVASAVNHPLDRLSVVVGTVVTNSLRTIDRRPVGIAGDRHRHGGAVVGGRDVGCQPNQIMV